MYLENPTSVSPTHLFPPTYLLKFSISVKKMSQQHTAPEGAVLFSASTIFASGTCWRLSRASILWGSRARFPPPTPQSLVWDLLISCLVEDWKPKAARNSSSFLQFPWWDLDLGSWCVTNQPAPCSGQCFKHLSQDLSNSEWELGSTGTLIIFNPPLRIWGISTSSFSQKMTMMLKFLGEVLENRELQNCSSAKIKPQVLRSSSHFHSRESGSRSVRG